MLVVVMATPQSAPVLDRFGGRAAQNGPLEGAARCALLGTAGGAPVVPNDVPPTTAVPAVVRVGP